MPIKLKASNGNIDLKVPIKQTGGGAVTSVNGQVGNVVLEIPSKTSQLENDSGFLTQHQDISGLATKSEVKAVEDKIPSLDNYATKDELFSKDYNDLTNKPTIPSLEGYATESWVENKNYLTQHQSLADYATKTELVAKQDTLTAGDNITIENGVISASGGSSGSSIKSIMLSTGKSVDGELYKELLTDLWGNGANGSVNLTTRIITIDGILINSAYVRSPYIYFYPAVSSNFDNSDKLAQYYYFCDYLTAMTKTQDYSYINKTQYATTLLTSNNYTQYIFTSGNYTTDVSDYNLSIASELYIGISTSDGRKSSVNIKLPQGYGLNQKTNEYFYFPESESSNGYVYYDGNNLNISGSNTIEYIWYK